MRWQPSLGRLCSAWTSASSPSDWIERERAGESPLFSFVPAPGLAATPSNDVDEQGRKVGPRNRQAFGRLPGEDIAIVLVVENDLEQASLDRARTCLQIGCAVALHAISRIEADVATAVEGRQDLEPGKHHAKTAHGEAPIIVRRGMEGLRPGRRHEGE